MIRAQMGLLVGRPHLEKGCLTVERDGDDVQMNMSIGGFCTSLSFLLFFSCVFFFFGMFICEQIALQPYSPTRSRTSTPGGDTARSHPFEKALGTEGCNYSGTQGWGWINRRF